MNIYQYSLKSFKHNAGKGIIFIIALSVMLLITVLNIATSMQRTIFEEAVSKGGDAHAVYNYITSEQAEQLKNHESVAWSDLWLTLNSNMWSYVPDMDKGISLVYSSRMGLMEGYRLVSGRAPQEENEVALAPHLARTLGIEAKVGETFSIVLCTFDAEAEGFANEAEYNFIISGVMQEQPYHEATDNFMLFLSEAFVKEHGSFGEEPGREHVGLGKNDMRQMFIHFKDGYFPIETADELAELAGVEEGNYNVNAIYIYSSLNDPTTLVAVWVILFVLMAVGALVINNVFNMMNARKTRSFGLLTLIGASKRQLRRIVYIEALLNTAVAIPIGLILGTAFSYLGQSIIEGMLNEGFFPVYYISPWSYVLTIALAVVMTFVGVLRPAIKASRVVPVEAVRFSGTAEKIRSRKKQVGNLTIPVLARLNMKRHRGRTVSVVLSLAFSGMLIVSITAVGMSMVSGSENYAKQIIAGDIRLMAGDELYTYAPNSDALTYDIIERYQNTGGVERLETFMVHRYCTEFTRSGDVVFPEYTSEFVGVEEDLMREVLGFVTIGESDFVQLQDGMSVLAVNSDYSFTREYNYELGQIIDAYLLDEQNLVSEQTVTVRVAGIIDYDDLPAYIYGKSIMPEFIVLQDFFEQNDLFTTISSALMDVTPERHDEIIEDVRELARQNESIYFEAFQEIKEQFEEDLAGTLVLVLLVLAIVTLVGILNLISSTFIGLQQRLREFGVLAALGLSPKGLRKMLTREGVVISLISVLVSTGLGLGAGYGIYYYLYNFGGANYMDFVFPTIPFVALLLIYGLVPYIVMSTAVRRLSKQTTVELLGQET